jgi:hypothetical protein
MDEQARRRPPVRACLGRRGKSAPTATDASYPLVASTRYMLCEQRKRSSGSSTLRFPSVAKESSCRRDPGR